jgi:hypothetical protein
MWVHGLNLKLDEMLMKPGLATARQTESFEETLSVRG